MKIYFDSLKTYMIAGVRNVKKVLFITSNSGVEHDELKKPLDFFECEGD